MPKAVPAYGVGLCVCICVPLVHLYDMDFSISESHICTSCVLTY